jgi:hypothetical protein
MKKLSLVIAIIFIVFYGCKKKVQTTPISSELLAAFNYQLGTYWIYRDSISGEIDSFFVTSNVPGAYVNGGGNYTINQIYISISQININSITFDTSKWAMEYQANMIDLKFYESNMLDYYINYFPLINYPFSYSLSACSGCFDGSSGIGSVYNIINNYSVNNNSFYNVAEINNVGAISPAVHSSHNDLFYICPTVGIIKMTLNHPQDSLYRVWEIIKWNIIK